MKLSGALEGALWMTATAAFLGASFAIVRYLSANFPVFELVFFRAAIGLLFMLPWIGFAGWRGLATRRIGDYSWRAATFFLGIALYYYALARLPVGDAVALYFTTPLFTLLFVALLLGERIGRRRILATLMGFGGALIVIRPGIAEVTLPMIAVLGTAVSYGIGNALTRGLALTESPSAMAVYNLALTLPLSLALAAFDWVMPGPEDALLLLALGMTGAFGEQCFARAFRAAPTATVMPPYFLQLPFGAGLAYLLLDEVPTIWVWLGAAVIVGAILYTLRLDDASDPVRR